MAENKIFQWGTKRRFNSLSDFFIREFGGRVQKVSVNAGFTCPNRDGKSGTGGCTYCDSMAFSPSYCLAGIPVREQVLKGIEFHRRRYPRASRYLAYFQSYTNTYDNPDNLYKLYSDALSVEGVIGLVIGTRPDCVDDEILKLISGFAEQYLVIVEYGIESCYNKTLKEINRGHDFRTSVDAIKRTAEFGIRTGGHIIFGLPGESRDEMLDQARILSALPLNNLKLHQLQIVRNTVMAMQYRISPHRFTLFELDDYLEFMVDFVERIRPSLVIERFSGEVPLRFIEGGPGWGMRSDQILALFERKLEARDSWQGKYYNEDNGSILT